MSSLKIRQFFFILLTMTTFLFPQQVHASFTSSSTLSNLVIGFGDWTPPTTSLTLLRGSQIFTPKELITNGSFEDGLNGWTTTGVVRSPHRTARLGNTQSFGKHTLQQTIQGKGSLAVTYRVIGFEQPLLPVFTIAINNDPIIQSTHIDGEERTVVIPLTQDSSTIAITLESHPLLTSTPVWAEISHVTTSKLTVGLQDLVQLTPSEPNSTTWFATKENELHQYTNPFAIADTTLRGLLRFWSVDDLNNAEASQQIAYIREDNLPSFPFPDVETLLPELAMVSFPQPPTTCPTSYSTQSAGSPLPLSSLPFIDAKRRAFITNHTPLTLIATSCFQTSSKPMEIVVP